MSVLAFSRTGILYPAALDLRDTRLARGLEPFVDVVSHAVTVVGTGTRPRWTYRRRPTRPLSNSLGRMVMLLMTTSGPRSHWNTGSVLPTSLPFSAEIVCPFAVHAVVCRNVLDPSGNTVHDSGVVLHGYIVFQHRSGVAFRLCGTQLRVRRHRDSADDREREREGGVFRQIGVLGILRADGDRDGKFFRSCPPPLVIAVALKCRTLFSSPSPLSVSNHTRSGLSVVNENAS